MKMFDCHEDLKQEWKSGVLYVVKILLQNEKIAKFTKISRTVVHFITIKVKWKQINFLLFIEIFKTKHSH